MPEGITRCVMIAAPHTSNWDFIYAIAAFDMLKIPVRFTIKKEMNKPIIGRFIERMGAIWIDRSPKAGSTTRRSMVEAMVELFKEHRELVVLVTPEGTRSLRTEWKTGFYYVAKEAGVPIALGYLDFKEKIAGVGDFFFPSDNMEADMQRITAFYKTKTPRHPELFSVDHRYDSPAV